jgi:hypothetical protein
MSPRIAAAALGIAAIVGAPLMASAVRAQINPPSSQSQAQLVQKLRDAREVAAENANSWTQEPITAREFGEQEAQLNDLIQRLKRGEKVSPSEVDRALQSPDTPY